MRTGAGYQEKLRDSVAPLTNEQLLLQGAAHMWPLGQLVQHVISVRAGWFSGTLQEDDEAMNAYMSWGQRDSPSRSALELARGLDQTLGIHRSSLAALDARRLCHDLSR